MLKKEERGKNDFPLDQTSTVLLFLPPVEWPVIQLRSANQPLNFALHYEDVVEYSWGECDGVDISQINAYINDLISLYFFSNYY